MKKAVSLFLALLLVCLTCPVVFAENTGITAFSVNPYGGEEDAIDTVSWFVSGGNRFLFLPADTDLTAAKIYFTATGDVTLDGEPIVSGDSAAIAVGAHTLACEAQELTLTVLQSLNLPTIFIDTESGSLDYLLQNKENKEPGTIRVYEGGVQTLDGPLKQIKGRGNSTWTFPKKPFNIKFDSKTSLLGMPKAKKWSLLANYMDDTDIKTPAGLTLGRWLGIPYTSESRNADLYLNGEYYGNFSVCESVEIGDNRIEITDLEKANEKANKNVDIEALPRGGTGPNGTVQNYKVKGNMKWVNIPNNPADITGGYLLELEFASRYGDEVSGFVSNRGQWVIVKSPEYASEAEVRYIAGLYNEAEEAIYSETGYNSLGKYYTEYFDMDTLVKTYLFMELQKPLDTAITSFFFYKDKGSDVLVAAPVWDFDRGFYSTDWRCNCDFTNPNDWCSNSFSYSHSGSDPFDTETFLSLVFRHEDFRAAAVEAWQASILGTSPTQIETLFSDLFDENAASRQMDLVRWKHASSSTALSSATNAGDSYFAKVSGFVHTRLSVLNTAFNGDIAMLYYDANGGTGHVFNREIAFVGGSVTVLATRIRDAYVTAPSGKKFCGWNTKADGTGDTYQPGSRITLNAATTTLYAIWKTQAEIDAEQQLAADTAAANTVQGKISEIGEVAYTEASKAKIDAARAAYNALTDAQKALVENYGTLTAAEARYAALAADRAAANAVQSAIAEIGDVAYSDASKTKIDAARAAYNALTDAQKALVENYGTLTTAEARYAELKAAAEAQTEPSSGNSGAWRSFLDFWQRLFNWFRGVFRAMVEWFRR